PDPELELDVVEPVPAIMPPDGGVEVQRPEVAVAGAGQGVVVPHSHPLQGNGKLEHRQQRQREEGQAPATVLAEKPHVAARPVIGASRRSTAARIGPGATGGWAAVTPLTGSGSRRESCRPRDPGPRGSGPGGSRWRSRPGSGGRPPGIEAPGRRTAGGKRVG